MAGPLCLAAGRLSPPRFYVAARPLRRSVTVTDPAPAGFFLPGVNPPKARCLIDCFRQDPSERFQFTLDSLVNQCWRTYRHSLVLCVTLPQLHKDVELVFGEVDECKDAGLSFQS